MDETNLRKLAELLHGSGCVTRNGSMAFRWGGYNHRSYMASACKPVLVMILLQAIRGGRISSWDEPVAKFEPRLADLNAGLGYKGRQITWRNLATQTSCYGVREQPGQAFDYNDCQTALFANTLLHNVFDATPEDATERVLSPCLTNWLRCEDKPGFFAPEPRFCIGRLRISPRDFCRIGLIVVRKGRWQERQVIDKEQLRLIVNSPLPEHIAQDQGREGRDASRPAELRIRRQPGGPSGFLQLDVVGQRNRSGGAPPLARCSA